MPNVQQQYDDVAVILRRLAQSSETIWSFGSDRRADGSTHALDEMKNDGIEMIDVYYVLSRCDVVRSEVSRFGETRYRAVGRNVDGINMTFIVTIIFETRQKIEIVTAWINQRKS